jgi:hypothetical protein
MDLCHPSRSIVGWGAPTNEHQWYAAFVPKQGKLKPVIRKTERQSDCSGTCGNSPVVRCFVIDTCMIDGIVECAYRTWKFLRHEAAVVSLFVQAQAWKAVTFVATVGGGEQLGYQWHSHNVSVICI